MVDVHSCLGSNRCKQLAGLDTKFFHHPVSVLYGLDIMAVICGVVESYGITSQGQVHTRGIVYNQHNWQMTPTLWSTKTHSSFPPHIRKTIKTVMIISRVKKMTQNAIAAFPSD